MPSCLIVGGGVVGLSLAYELAGHDWTVRVIDPSEPGQEASWAGAGILPAANEEQAVHPLEKLRGLSHRLHSEWAERLQAETGIDTGYRKCGGLYLARSAGEAAALAALRGSLQEEGIAFDRVPLSELTRWEPELDASGLRSAWHMPDEAQLRNPRHLKALRAACERRGVVVSPRVGAESFDLSGDTLRGIRTPQGLLTADRYCFCAGAWTGLLLKQLGIATGILPIRGQMILFRAERVLVSRVLNEGPRYLVPRDDARVLVGSTEEEEGFRKSTTECALSELRSLANALVPALGGAVIEDQWAGLRPGSFDGFPYLGAVPGLTNAFVAAGHFRSGLHMSPGTAVVMSELIRGEAPRIDLAPFSVCRG